MDKPTLLVVEDDTELSLLYQEMFKKRGWRVVHTLDGEQAVNMALENVPNVILLDLMLPKKGGLSVLKILKTMPETRDIPIVVITAYPNQEYKDEAVRSGCDHYILKADVSHPQLADLIDKIVRGPQRQEK